jgi:hypothetical protein
MLARDKWGGIMATSERCSSLLRGPVAVKGPAPHIIDA